MVDSRDQSFKGILGKMVLTNQTLTTICKTTRRKKSLDKVWVGDFIHNKSEERRSF